MTTTVPAWDDETEFDPYVASSNNHHLALKELETLYGLSDDLFAITTRSSLIVWTNPAWRRTLGWQVTELQARTWPNMVHPDDVEIMMKTIVEMWHTKCLFVTARMQHSNGSYVRLDFKVSQWTFDGHAFNRARLAENADIT